MDNKVRITFIFRLNWQCLCKMVCIGFFANPLKLFKIGTRLSSYSNLTNEENKKDIFREHMEINFCGELYQRVQSIMPNLASDFDKN